METSRISIVIPLFEKAATIERTLASIAVSIINASVSATIIIVDDGSTDDGPALAQAWAVTAPKSISVQIITQPNQGISKTRNVGWQQAKTDLVFFCDADDVWEPRHAQEILRLAEDFPTAVIYATAWHAIDHKGQAVTHQFGRGTDERGLLPCFFTAMATGPMVVCASSCAIKRSALEQIGGFPEDINNGEDKVTWGRLALIGDVAYTPSLGACYPMDAPNRSYLRPDNHVGAYRDFLAETLTKGTFPPSMKHGLQMSFMAEAARLSGLITGYDRETPQKITELVTALKTQVFF